MATGLYNVPKAVNEPVKSYAPGSPERKLLLDTYKKMYNEKVMDHFENPRNIGKMDDATVFVEVGSPECGDTTTMYLKIKDDIIGLYDCSL